MLALDVNVRRLQLECARMLLESLLVVALMCIEVRQWYGGRRKDLGLELYRLLTFGVG